MRNRENQIKFIFRSLDNKLQRDMWWGCTFIFGVWLPKRTLNHSATLPNAGPTNFWEPQGQGEKPDRQGYSFLFFLSLIGIWVSEYLCAYVSLSKCVCLDVVSESISMPGLRQIIVIWLIQKLQLSAVVVGPVRFVLLLAMNLKKRLCRFSFSLNFVGRS